MLRVLTCRIGKWSDRAVELDGIPRSRMTAEHLLSAPPIPLSGSCPVLATLGTLYAQDFVPNARGMTSAVEEYVQMLGCCRKGDAPLAVPLERIHDHLPEIPDRAALAYQRPKVTTEHLAREIIGRGGDVRWP